MNRQLSRSAVWDFIAPAVPDSLEDLGNMQYLAKWWKPVPMHDVETLLRMPGIKIHGEPYELKSLPEGLVVQFSIEEKVTSDHVDDEASPIEARLRSSVPLQKTGS